MYRHTVNRGKQFEGVIKQTFEEYPNTTIQRLKDAANGHQKGNTNPCDFIAYKFPHIIYIECKATNTTTEPFTRIRPNQIDGLHEAREVFGVEAGFMIWFVSKQKTYWIRIEDFEEYRTGRKSIRLKDCEDGTLPAFEITSKPKRILCEYDLASFFDYIVCVEPEEL